MWKKHLNVTISAFALFSLAAGVQASLLGVERAPGAFVETEVRVSWLPPFSDPGPGLLSFFNDSPISSSPGGAGGITFNGSGLEANGTFDSGSLTINSTIGGIYLSAGLTGFASSSDGVNDTLEFLFEVTDGSASSEFTPRVLATVTGQNFDFFGSQSGINSGDLRLTGVAPAPATTLLLLPGLIIALALRRRAHRGTGRATVTPVSNPV